MKRFTLIILGIACFTWTQAQEVQVGPQFGMNITNDFDRINAGGIVNFGSNDLFSLRSGILYSQKGTSLGNQSIKYNYLHIPVTPQLNFGNRLKVFIRGGGYAALNLKPATYARSVDLGVEVGTGLRYSIGPGETILDLSYSIGALSRNSNTSERIKIYNRVVGISFGYLITLDQNHSD